MLEHQDKDIQAPETQEAAPEEETCPESPQCPEEDGTPKEDHQARPDPLEELQAKYGELNDRYLRLMAEYDNFRKRTQREKDEMYQNATASVVEKFLATADNFERASQHALDSEEFKKGFELIHTNFKSVLDSLHVASFGEVGEPFDPEKHNAVSHIEDDSLGDNTISQVFQKGYQLGDRVIRYAMVQTAN